jgi:hypothetical protein
MKPFDLEKALAGEPVVTKNGQSVSQLTLFSLTKDDYCIYGVIEGRIQRWVRSGQYDVNVENHDLDLFMVQPEQWVNVYWISRNNNWCNGPYPTEEIAKQNSLHHPNYQATIKLKDSTKEK